MALQLEIVTPSQRALETSCDEVQLPGALGSFGVLPGHTPVLALLKPGALYLRNGGETQTYALGEGFAEVSQDHVRVLVEEADRANQNRRRRRAEAARAAPGEVRGHEERRPRVRADAGAGRAGRRARAGGRQEVTSAAPRCVRAAALAQGEPHANQARIRFFCAAVRRLFSGISPEEIFARAPEASTAAALVNVFAWHDAQSFLKNFPA